MRCSSCRLGRGLVRAAFSSGTKRREVMILPQADIGNATEWSPTCRRVMKVNTQHLPRTLALFTSIFVRHLKYSHGHQEIRFIRP